MGLHEPTTRGRGRKQRNKGRYLLMKWNQSFWSGCCCHVLRGRAGARSRRVHCRDCLSLENPRGSPECLGGRSLHPGGWSSPAHGGQDTRRRKDL